jgi:deoxyribodipyrimidine photo-lyase
VQNFVQLFPANRAAVQERIAAISPSTYARTRNALDGAVTRLSPYLTHGFVSLPEVATQLAQQHRLSYADKLIFEFAWREFFAHVRTHSPHPDDILRDMRPALLPREAYANEMPADIREGRSGVPCIDAAVSELYQTGYLHNHARMWLASYCVHLRKVHWRVAADWLYAHLLDGDLASNHLSWQWMASTFSAKPYLFNTENVAKFTPQNDWKRWHSPRTAIDQSYEALEDLARSSRRVGAEPGLHQPVAEPALLRGFDPDFLKCFEQFAGIKPAHSAIDLIVSKLSQLAPDARVELVTPWSMGERSDDADQPAPFRIGIVHAAAHQHLPWSEQRWRFVLTRLQDVCDALWIGDVAQLSALPNWPAKQRVIAQASLYEGYRDILPRIAELSPIPKLFVQPQRICHSFSKFYEQAQRGERDFSRLLLLPKQAILL